MFSEPAQAVITGPSDFAGSPLPVTTNGQEPSCHFAPDSARQTHTLYTGDLLLSWRGSAYQPVARRTAEEWQSTQLNAQETVFTQPPTESWRGWPLTVMACQRHDVWLVGELYGHQSQAAIAAALSAVVEDEKPAATLNGHFLLLARERQTGCWQVWTDRFGTVHCYYTQAGAGAALGTFFPAVAALLDTRRLDANALAGFLSNGFFPQDLTWFAGVRILRPATHYVFDAQGKLTHERRYWHWRQQPEHKRSYDDTVAQFRATLDEVLAEQSSAGRIAIPLSGGLDSRSTVASLTQQVRAGAPPDERFWAYSYGYTDNSVETRIAREIARARRLPFQAHTIKPYLFDRLDQILACTEGFQDVTQPRQVAVADQLAQHADYVIAAHWGDVWLDDAGLHNNASAPDRETVLEHTLKKMRKRGSDWLVQHCKLLAEAEARATVREMTRQGLAALADIEDADFRVKAFKTEHWSFRWTLASLRSFQLAAQPRLCFYDNRLADFFCTTSTAYVSGRRLQIDYLKRYAPDLARITWQLHEANLYRYQNSYIRSLPRRLANKGLRTLLRQPAIQRNWEVQFLNPPGRLLLEQHLTAPGLKLHELFEPQALTELLKQFYRQPTAESGYAVSMLLTISAWLEKFA